MDRIRNIDINAFAEWAGSPAQPYQHNYYAMYSSILDGIVTNPRLMTVPVDDHIVHRGDGVFETFKCVAGNIYNMRAHLERLCNSARGLFLERPFERSEMDRVIVKTVRAGGHRDCSIRVLLSRGPGTLGVNPYDCPAPSFYVVVSRLKPPFMDSHPGGGRAVSSRIPVKPPPFATIKSANYLLNVLMKKEAVDAGVDFVLTFDEQGFLAEGATENAGVITADAVLRVPRPQRILAGTTMQRVLQLAETLVNDGALAKVEQTNISKDEITAAAELLIFGTTPDVTAVVEFDGKPIGDGRPGPRARELNARLRHDILENRDMQTPAF